MARSCPVCPSQQLNAVQASDVEVDICPRCHGLFFDRGELERFPDRPSLKPLMGTARNAASRCRAGGHLVPRALASCATCRSEPMTCPGCGARLGLVSARVCTVDLCAQCGGAWLDTGKFEVLENATVEAPKAPPASARAGWEVAPATDGGADPWNAPGARAPLPPSHSLTGGAGLRSPMACIICERQVPVSEAWAWDGDVYCGEHHPKGAVSGASLPRHRHVDPLPNLTVSRMGRVVRDGPDWADLVHWVVQLLRIR
ncbi:zf-TFIIB domain-containing protein [Corallococcus sp. BB11-1]|uniref:TFIIB-type zinc ribbon-containing protein n=1 Tax=Corallococcus sp. BB11-1 TaxID=2996783 RepID=UPI00226ECE74|nr:zf-TFIIB domain-containing protein [Corallococcus sp. BB11-1]MCY1032113.1 zf-TFIIB domain-containing protein [Corallococcus sp. BB11-1]